MATLNELFKEHQKQGGEGNTFFLGFLLIEQDTPFREFYRNHYKDLDKWLIKVFGYREFDGSIYDFHILNLNACVGNINSINQLFKALETEYNPLENYDRTEDTNNYDMYGKITSVTGNDKATTTNGNTTNDSATFYDTTKTVTDTVGRTDYINHHHDKHKTSSHIHGNIGVTTNTQMALGEVELRTTLNTFITIFDMLISQHTYYIDRGIDIL